MILRVDRNTLFNFGYWNMNNFKNAIFIDTYYNNY